MSAQITTRFAPSPTGYMHIGRARTALFNYLFTRKNGGKMIFRIEDTDKERSKKEYEENIVECLEWLGIRYDLGPYRQSERARIYISYLKKLIENGAAFVSKDEENGNEVIRFKNPNKKIRFNDLIRGEIEFDTTDLGDFVIARSLEEPLYHLAVVIDDHQMGVTHVIRGEDGISNTPRQILIQEGIGAVRPIYAHIPLILAADKSKLSGRHGAVSVTEYKKKGYLPEAVVNFLALLGWHPSDEREIMSPEELVQDFSIERVQKSGAIFDEEKLKWFNREYLKKLSDDEFLSRAQAFLPEWIGSKSDVIKQALPLLREKISVFGDIEELFSPGGELAFTRKLTDYGAGLLLWKKNPDKEAARIHLNECRNLLQKIRFENFDAETVKTAVWPYAEAKGRGDVLWPLRVALTGQEKSPDPFVSAAILGKDESLARVDAAIHFLNPLSYLSASRN